MAESESVAASFVNAALPNTLDTTVRMPSCSFADYCAHYGWFTKARQLTRSLLDGWSTKMNGRRGMCYDIDMGAWNHTWSLMCH